MSEIRSVLSVIIGLFRERKGRRKSQGQVYKDLGLYNWTTSWELNVLSHLWSVLYVVLPRLAHFPPCHIALLPVLASSSYLAHMYAVGGSVLFSVPSTGLGSKQCQ